MSSRVEMLERLLGAEREISDALLAEYRAGRQEDAAEIRRLTKLLVEHHRAGALDEALVGDRCPICHPQR